MKETNEQGADQFFVVVNARMRPSEREELRAASERLRVPMSTLMRDGARLEIRRLEREQAGG